MLDLDLCQQALKLNPDLWFATQLVARVKGKPVFPIKTVNALVEVLADKPGSGHCRLDGVVLTAVHASTYFPVRFLPIVDEEQLLRALYSALNIGRTLHSLELQVEVHKRAISSLNVPDSFM